MKQLFVGNIVKKKIYIYIYSENMRFAGFLDVFMFVCTLIMWYFSYTKTTQITKLFFFSTLDRHGVARAVLQTESSLIK